MYWIMYFNPSTNVTHFKFPFNHESAVDLVIDDEQYHLDPLKQFLWKKLNETLLNTTTTTATITTTTTNQANTIVSSHRSTLFLILFISIVILLIGLSVIGYYIWKRQHNLSYKNNSSFSFPIESLSLKDLSATVHNEPKKGTALVSELFPYLV